jgi:hypothetical protein
MLMSTTHFPISGHLGQRNFVGWTRWKAWTAFSRRVCVECCQLPAQGLITHLIISAQGKAATAQAWRQTWIGKAISVGVDYTGSMLMMTKHHRHELRVPLNIQVAIVFSLRSKHRKF